jgi:hypothetical protein
MPEDRIGESLKGLPGWSEVGAVWLDVEEGEAVMNIFMLPGPRTEFAAEFMVFGNMFLVLVGDRPERISLSVEEFQTMFSLGNVDIGVHVALLDKRDYAKPLYNWLLKAVENSYHVYKFNVTDIDGETLSQTEAVHILDEELMKEFRKLLNLLVENHGRVLKGFRGRKTSSLELEILGPTYLLKGSALYTGP